MSDFPTSEVQGLIYQDRYLYERIVELEKERSPIRVRLKQLIKPGEIVDYGHVYAQIEEVLVNPTAIEIKKAYPGIDLNRLKVKKQILYVRSRTLEPLPYKSGLWMPQNYQQQLTDEQIEC